MMFYDGDFIEHFRQSDSFKSDADLPINNERLSMTFCVVCMDRLLDLQRTLPINLKDAESYSQADFLLLDYSSQEPVGDWVASDLADELRSGRLKYYRVEGQSRFRPSHSKNVAFRLAEGEIVVSVDADNFIHAGFAEAVNECFGQTRVMAVSSDFLRIPGRLLLKGRFALRKADYLNLGGLDEDLDYGYGYDDVSLVFRAAMAGFTIARFDAKYLEGRIETTDDQRVSRIGDNFEQLKVKNKKIAMATLARGQTQVNLDKQWGFYDSTICRTPTCL